MSLITELDEWLQQKRLKYYTELLPGLTDDEYEGFINQIGFSLPSQFRALYQWKNGQSGFQSFFYNYELMGVQQILQSFNLLNDCLEQGDFSIENWWSSQWLPFLSDHCGNYFCLDTIGSFNGRPGQILEFYHDQPTRIIHHQSMENWLETMITAYVEGFSIIDNYFDYEVLKNEGYTEFFARINPGYPIINTVE